MTDRELVIVDRMLYPADAAKKLTIDEIAELRGIKRHSAEKILSIVRGKLHDAGIKTEYPGKKRCLMPMAGRTQDGPLSRIHFSIERDTVAELSELAEVLGTSMGALANDAILEALERLRGMAKAAGG